MLARILFRSSRLTSSRFVPSHALRPAPRSHLLTPSHRFASHTSNPSVESTLTELQDLYATARDEFEIASEETSKKTVYAADDRAAAQEELAKLKAAFDKAVLGEGGDEVRTRVGSRVRELERAVEAMEEAARED